MLVKYIIAQEKFKISPATFQMSSGTTWEQKKKILIRIMIPNTRSRKIKIKISYNVVLESTLTCQIHTNETSIHHLKREEENYAGHTL